MDAGEDRWEPTASDTAEFERSSPHASGPGDRLVVPEWAHPQWAALFSYTRPVRLEAGEVLILPRESDRAVFFLTSGRLEVASTSERDGSVSPLASVPAGSVVGEVAFFDGGPRSAKAWAVAPTRLLRLTLHDYQRYASEHATDAAALLFAMARLLAFRVRRLTAREERPLVFPNRSRAIQDALVEKLDRLEHSRLARECAKLDPKEEKAWAEERWTADLPWPEY